MTTWKTTTISAVVHQAGDNPIINECSTTVTICDEAAGAFISLTDSEGTTIKLDPEELEMVFDVARKMLCDFDGDHSDGHRTIDEDPDEDDKEIIRPATPFAATCDLLAVIHRDGGQHTGEVGTVQSCKDAEAVVHALMLDSTMLDSTMATDDAKIVTCLFRYIDRMNDVCEEDPADTILREFVADVMPLINERIRKSNDHKRRHSKGAKDRLYRA